MATVFIWISAITLLAGSAIIAGRTGVWTGAHSAWLDKLGLGLLLIGANATVAALLIGELSTSWGAAVAWVEGAFMLGLFIGIWIVVRDDRKKLGAGPNASRASE